MRLFAALLLSLALPAQASEALWSLLKGGGQVVLIRHAVTTPGAGDPPGFRLEDCATQRNLTDEGRDTARRVGARLHADALQQPRQPLAVVGVHLAAVGFDEIALTPQQRAGAPGPLAVGIAMGIGFVIQRTPLVVITQSLVYSLLYPFRIWYTIATQQC